MIVSLSGTALRRAPGGSSPASVAPDPGRASRSIVTSDAATGPFHRAAQRFAGDTLDEPLRNGSLTAAVQTVLGQAGRLLGSPPALRVEGPLYRSAIHDLFAAGLALQGIAGCTVGAVQRRLIDVIADLDELITGIRDTAAAGAHDNIDANNDDNVNV